MDNEKELGKITIDSYSHYITLCEEDINGKITMSRDLYDGEPKYYIDFYSKFIKSISNEFSDYNIALAYLESAKELLQDIPLHEYNYKHIEDLINDLNNLLTKTKEKDPYSKDYKVIKGYYEE